MTRRMAIAVFGIAMSVGFGGCRTAPIPAPASIPVPSGMTAQQREVAILAGIYNTPPPASYDPAQEMPPDVFESFLWKEFVGSARGRSWFLESRDGSTIYAAVDTRGLFLRAAIEQEDSAIRISIVGSRNLRQSDTRIHKRAIKWIRNLEAHVRREIGRMSVFARPE